MAPDEVIADPLFVQYVESVLAGTIGSASARVMVASIVDEAPLNMDEVITIIDETSQVLAHSRELEQKSLALERATDELRRANQRLQELDRIKDDFVSTVTHELRTPLTSIRAFSEILQSNPDIGNDQKDRFLGIIVRESERLTRLINQVLDLSKIESGNAEWHTTAVDLREVIEDAVSSVSQVCVENGIELGVTLAESVPCVMADRDRVTQVLLNLLSNAAKFCPANGGRIEVRLTRISGGLQVDVTDNGIGIAETDQTLIFEKFRQAGDTLTGKPKGSGLGLAISREIINHYGGRLWVRSAPGAGATFSFTVSTGGLQGAAAA